MEILKDFRELLALLNDHQVDYLVVGGYALAFHGAPRFTGDLDIYVQPTSENARRVLSALEDFGFGDLDIQIEDLALPDRVVQLGVAPIRVDLITSISGVTWDEAHAGRVAGTYGDVPVHFVGLDALATNKRATGRAKDLADLEALGLPPAAD